MLDFLYSIDLSIFFFINHNLSSVFLDKFFSLITDVTKWYIAYVILLGILFRYGGKKGKIAAVAVIILILCADQLGAKLLKELFQRVRPCNALADVLTPLGCTGSFSFPSNHALNNFAVAVFFHRLYPNLKWVLFITAVLISLSRVYLGLHYPSDVIGGALIGSLIGYVFSLVINRINSKLKY
ncbi:MAG TPA: phosphatase PAP2 family protein [Ignavibacteriaceae bacterium]|nr:phosphatase PAP2 family protein [Ignavibacteriaceae bacterium]